jgi:exosortase/archaeosortase family protein
MRSRALGAFIRPVAVVVLVMVTFVLGNALFRQWEATAATALLHLFDLVPEHRLQVIPGTSSIAVFPTAVGPFVAVLLPSCSSLASLLAIGFLAGFVPRGRPGRRITALGCALVCVLVGNVLRIAASIGVGLIYGTPSLVLFHDLAGSMFAFAYTLGGYLLMLFLLLPAGTASAAATAPTRPAGAPTPAHRTTHSIRTSTAAHRAGGRRKEHRVPV